MKGICKRFPGVLALDNVDFRLYPGKVHALMGENGAGKSTLMKVLAGLHTPDEGTITLSGQKIVIDAPRRAMEYGIAMIHQELNPVLEMTIAENLFLGREFIGPARFIDYRKMNREATKLLDYIGVDINPGKYMRELTVSQMQMVEIAKAVSYNANIIIMDEPTSAITTKEVDRLFEIIRLLKSENKCVIYITHKMDEIFAISDEITVFRDGRYIGTYDTDSINELELIRLMVARDLNEMFPEKTCQVGQVRLKVENLSRKGYFENVSFEVKAGEIFGLAGLIGAGRTEVVESIFGVHPPDSGRVLVDGAPIERYNPKSSIKKRMGLVTEDRKLSGLILPMNILDNIALPSLPQLSTAFGLLKVKQTAKVSTSFMESLRIKAPSHQTLVMNLSGGNQQKVILAKWMATEPSVMIFDEPTRGIDVGAKSEIYKLVVDMAARGVAIVMISSEMKEILGMCDRIMVMRQGSAVAIVERSDATQEGLLLHATGMADKSSPELLAPQAQTLKDASQAELGGRT
ncbi:MAG: sugar ABC transporter ATP-binding protein [Deltaproteobacteria bacterium]|nr:sugar ABC transporter ATP-binding protein [Deltaproteobacteria bacterium]